MWKTEIKKLNQRRELHRLGGGEKRIEKQHAAGKLTAAERISLLLDPDTFVEVDSLMSSDVGASCMPGAKAWPGDGVLIGWGLIDGRKVCVAAEDFTVVGGTLGKNHAKKISRLLDLAFQMRVPVILLNDSGGARIEEGIHSLNGYGEIFQQHVRASGVIPQISAILGPCSGGACYSPALCDFLFAVNDISKLFITGPAVVEQVLGKRPTFEELGGAKMHASKSGCVQILCEDEVSCLAGIRKLISYLPSNCSEPTPVHTKGRRVKTAKTIDWQSLVPDQARKSYDMRRVISALMDPGEELFEIYRDFAPNAITGFSYLDGHVLGIVANQPLWLGGSLDVDASDKIARFIRFCDSFGIPLLTLVDVPAFLPGTEQEQHGIIRHGAKILYAYAEARVARITVIVRKAYGGAYIAMNSKSMGADLVYAWPIAQLAVMGAEGAVNILYRKELAASEDPKRLLDEKIADYEERFLNTDTAEQYGYVDEVILPEETRPRLISSFAFLSEKHKDIAGGLRFRHGNIPL